LWLFLPSSGNQGVRWTVRNRQQLVGIPKVQLPLGAFDTQVDARRPARTTTGLSAACFDACQHGRCGGMVPFGLSGCGRRGIVYERETERRAHHTLFRLEQPLGCAERSQRRVTPILVTLYESIAVKNRYDHTFDDGAAPRGLASSAEVGYSVGPFTELSRSDVLRTRLLWIHRGSFAGCHSPGFSCTRYLAGQAKSTLPQQKERENSEFRCSKIARNG
jgi:hypothetical protein